MVPTETLDRDKKLFRALGLCQRSDLI
jgi:hypothetical protein